MAKPASTDRLTPRESEVALGYAAGGTYREVAGRLGMAPATARTHLAAIYRKLGVTTKVELLDRMGFLRRKSGRADATGIRPDGRPSLVVVPFVNRSGDPADEPLIDGLVERVTALLSRVGFVTTIAAASGLTYRGTSKAVDEIGSELGTRYVLRGAVQRAAGRLRISARLIEAATGVQVWGDAYDGASPDIFAIQDEVADRVALAVLPELHAREVARANGRITGDLTAWLLYCRAYHHAHFFTPKGFQAARGDAERAVEADPGFAAPHAILARIALLEGMMYRGAQAAELFAETVRHARDALLRDARDEVAVAALACGLSMRGEWDEALAVGARSVEVNANCAEAFNARAFAHVMAPTGDLARVVEDSRAALRLSPVDPMRWTFLSNIGMAHLARDEDGDLEEAYAAFREASYEARTGWGADSGAALAALGMGDRATFERHLARARAAKPDLSVRDHRNVLGHLMSRSARTRDLVERLRDVLPVV